MDGNTIRRSIYHAAVEGGGIYLDGKLGRVGSRRAALPEFIPPRGFHSIEHFRNFVSRFRIAAAVDDAVIGVRGSAATGVSAETGAPFASTSDIDFFVVSDELFGQALAKGAKSVRGALRVGATMRYLPVLHEAELALSRELGRKVTIRVYSQLGYEFVRDARDVIGR
jgi:hypothetical protein